MDREKLALEVMQTQREPDLRGSQWIQREFDFRGRVIHSKGVYLRVQVGEGHIPILSRRCHGFISPDKFLKSKRLLGAECLPR